MKRVLILFLTLFLASCGFTNSSDGEGKILDVELPLKPTSIAPYESVIPTEIGVTETLFTMRNGKLENTLVDEYEQVDKNTFKMTIKDVVTFQNGNELTGEAVKNSIKYSLENSAYLKGSLPIEDIEVDGQEVTITTSEPYPNLAAELANPFIAIYDTDSEHDENDQPVGTGPYSIKTYERTKIIDLERYDDYWQGEPRLDGVKVTFHEDGDMRANHIIDGSIDLTTNIPIQRIEEVETSENSVVDISEGLRVSYLIYNFEKNYMTKNVREAIDSRIDREGIVENIFDGYASATTSPFSKEEVKDVFDIEHAKALMEEEGYDEDNRLQLTVATYDGRPELTKILETIQSDVKDIYIDIEIQSVDDIEAFLEDKDNFDGTMYSFLTEPRVNKMYYFDMAYYPGGPVNKGVYEDNKVKALIEKRRHTIDLDEQEDVDQSILSITSEDIVNSYIARTDNIVAFNSKVKGIEATPEAIELINYKVDMAE